MTCHGRLLASPYLHVTMFAVCSSPQGHPRPPPPGDWGTPRGGPTSREEKEPLRWDRRDGRGCSALSPRWQQLGDSDARGPQRRSQPSTSSWAQPHTWLLLAAPLGCAAPSPPQLGTNRPFFVIIIFGRDWQYLAQKVISHCLPFGGAGEGSGPSRARVAPPRSRGGVGGDASKCFVVSLEPPWCCHHLPTSHRAALSLPSVPCKPGDAPHLAALAHSNGI